MYKGFTRVLDIFLIYKGFGKFGGSKLGVIVMFPTKGISKVQRQQMVSCTAHNVKVAMLPLVILQCCHVAMLPTCTSTFVAELPCFQLYLLMLPGGGKGRVYRGRTKETDHCGHERPCCWRY